LLSNGFGEEGEGCGVGSGLDSDLDEGDESTGREELEEEEDDDDDDDDSDGDALSGAGGVTGGLGEEEEAEGSNDARNASSGKLTLLVRGFGRSDGSLELELVDKKRSCEPLAKRQLRHIDGSLGPSGRMAAASCPELAGAMALAVWASSSLDLALRKGRIMSLEADMVSGLGAEALSGRAPELASELVVSFEAGGCTRGRSG
jgi:hypothetical protein